MLWVCVSVCISMMLNCPFRFKESKIKLRDQTKNYFPPPFHQPKKKHIFHLIHFSPTNPHTLKLPFCIFTETLTLCKYYLYIDVFFLKTNVLSSTLFPNKKLCIIVVSVVAIDCGARTEQQ